MASRRRPPAEIFEQYVVTVAAWNLSWLFAVSDPKRDPDPYREYTNLVFHGEIHRPAPFRYPRAEVTLSGRAELPEPWQAPQPQSIGHLEGRDGLLRAYVTVPAERLALLTATAARVRLVALSGGRLSRGRGLVRSLHVDTRFDPEEW
jgi:hypothetical protein